MKTKNIMALALLPMMGMLTACSSDNEQTAERVPISLTASTVTIMTRAAADTTLNNGYMEAEQAVKVRIRNTGGTSDDWTDYAFTSKAGGTLKAPTPPPFYPLDNTNVDIVAYSPYEAGSTFVVQEDQSNNDNYMASDLLFASKSNQEKTTDAVPLQFEHKMAKVVVNAIASAASGVSRIQAIRLQNVKRQVNFDTETGSVSNAITYGSTTVNIVNDGNTTIAAGAAVIPAQTISGTLLTVVTDIGTATYTIDSKTFSAGKVYRLDIRVGRTSIGGTTAITNWTDTQGAVVSTGDDEVKIFILSSYLWPTWRMPLVMIRVEGGSYNTLGGKSVTGTLSDFYISQTEMTNDMWQIVMDVEDLPTTNALDHKNTANVAPVTMVNYNDLMAANTGFIARLNSKLSGQLDGRSFNLPSEAQWEYAARGGKYKENYTYAGSDNIGWVAYYGKKGTKDTPKYVGVDRAANRLGIFDMSGNVWELCRDYYQDNIPTSLGKDYVYTTSTGRALWRGGGYNSDEAECAVSYRASDVISAGGNDGGFRIVLQ